MAASRLQVRGEGAAVVKYRWAVSPVGRLVDVIAGLHRFAHNGPDPRHAWDRFRVDRHRFRPGSIEAEIVVRSCGPGRSETRSVRGGTRNDRGSLARCEFTRRESERSPDVPVAYGGAPGGNLPLPATSRRIDA